MKVEFTSCTQGNKVLERQKTYVVFCAIWYHLHNLINVKNTHGGVLLLVKFKAFLKVTLLHRCFSRFFKCTNDTKSRNASHIKKCYYLLNFKWTMKLYTIEHCNTCIVSRMRIAWRLRVCQFSPTISYDNKFWKTFHMNIFCNLLDLFDIGIHPDCYNQSQNTFRSFCLWPCFPSV